MSPITFLSYLFYFLTAAGITLYIFFWKRFKYWKLRNIKQLEPSFPTGNFHDVLLQRKSIGEFVKDMYDNCKEDLLGFYIFHKPHILVRSPEIIKDILVRDFSSFHDRNLISDEKADVINSKALFVVKNPEWRLIRQKITPVFTASKLRSMSVLVNKVCNDWLDYIDKNHVQPIETKELCAKLTTDIITSCAFGLETNCFQDDNAEFREVGRKMAATSLKSAIRFMCYFMIPQAVRLFKLPVFDPDVTTFLKEAFLKTIDEREKRKHFRGDLIDTIIELKKNKDLGEGIVFEGDRVIAQAIQFFVAGFETTSATISIALYELALNKGLQEEVRQSVRDLMHNGGQFDYDSMLKLDLLERVILETLRKYPSLPFLDRRSNREYTTTTGQTIPKDMPVFISVMGLHYDEKYYPNPHKFDPDRFLPEAVKERHPYTFLAFGQGPHNCIGDRFAMNAIKLSLAQFLLKYKVLPCDETPIPIQFSPKSFVLIPTKGVPLRFIKL